MIRSNARDAYHSVRHFASDFLFGVKESLKTRAFHFAEDFAWGYEDAQLRIVRILLDHPELGPKLFAEVHYRDLKAQVEAWKNIAESLNRTESGILRSVK